MNRITFFLYLGEIFIESTTSQLEATNFLTGFDEKTIKPRVVILKAPQRFYGSASDFRTDLVTFTATCLADMEELCQRKELH